MGLLEQLIMGSYVFTGVLAAAGARAFHYLYKQITNHQNTRLSRLEREVFGEEQE